MGVVAAEAEGVDRGAARPLGVVPGFGPGEDSHRRLADRLDRVLGVDGRRQRARLEGAEDLDDRRGPRSGDHVAEVGLESAHRQVLGAGEDRRHAPDLDRVANAGAGGVALDVTDRQRIDARHAISLAHGADLAAAVGREQPALAAVIGEADAADHGKDAVAGIDRVVEPFQCEERRALGREQPVGVPGQRTAPAARRKRAQRREADVKEQIVGVVEAAGQHHVAGPVVEQVAGELHRIERRGAGRVEREGRAFEPERARRELRREARDEAVLRQRRRSCPLTDAGEPSVAGEVGEAAARIGEVADDQAALMPRVAGNARRVERLPPAMEEPAEGRVEGDEPRRVDAKPGRDRTPRQIPRRSRRAHRPRRRLGVGLGPEDADRAGAPGALAASEVRSRRSATAPHNSSTELAPGKTLALAVIAIGSNIAPSPRHAAGPFRISGRDARLGPVHLDPAQGDRQLAVEHQVDVVLVPEGVDDAAPHPALVGLAGLGLADDAALPIRPGRLGAPFRSMPQSRASCRQPSIAAGSAAQAEPGQARSWVEPITAEPPSSVIGPTRCSVWKAGPWKSRWSPYTAAGEAARGPPQPRKPRPGRRCRYARRPAPCSAAGRRRP